MCKGAEKGNLHSAKYELTRITCQGHMNCNNSHKHKVRAGYRKSQYTDLWGFAVLKVSQFLVNASHLLELHELERSIESVLPHLRLEGQKYYSQESPEHYY